MESEIPALTPKYYNGKMILFLRNQPKSEDQILEEKETIDSIMYAPEKEIDISFTFNTSRVTTEELILRY